MDAANANASCSDKTITAYYSLVFPTYTFYLQTLTCTIGRRTAATSGPHVDDLNKVDVDLGPLKSVSRLHAKIEYDSDVESFVISIIGRNGAWIDGVWAKGGSRVALGDHTQIQIASRIFQFVLPPSPPPPDDSPTPSPPSSGIRAARSPSVDIDITSISSASSPLSHSPPLPGVLTPKPRAPSLEPEPDDISVSTLPPPALPPLPTSKPAPIKPEPELTLPNSNDIRKTNASKPSAKKRKKVGPDPSWERPKPEDMPSKPPFTYAQLIYRAIKAIGNKATLQEICNWIMTEFDYYKWCDGAWMSSVRHNLSSGKAFKKLERCGGDRGKGFFWSVDEALEHTFLEQEAKALSGGKKKDKGGAPASDPPLKRSIKGDSKVPLPPPLTSAPLVPKSSAGAAGATQANNNKKNVSASTTPGLTSQHPNAPASSAVIMNRSRLATTTTPHPTVGKMEYSAQPISGPNMYGAHSVLTTTTTPSPWPQHHPLSHSLSHSASPAPQVVSPPLPITTKSSASTSSAQAAVEQFSASIAFLDPNARVPIVIGLPPSHAQHAYASSSSNTPTPVPDSQTSSSSSFTKPPMVLHENKIYLSPEVFAHLTKEQLAGLEALGMQKSLEILSGYMARFLKEKMKRPKGGKKKNRDKEREKEGVVGGGGGGGVKEKRKKDKSANGDKNGNANAMEGVQATTNAGAGDSSASGVVVGPEEKSVLPPPPDGMDDDPGSPIVIVDDEDSDPVDARAMKRRKLC